MIELRPSDLSIKTLDDGREIVQLKPSIAFDESFVSEMRQCGVKPYVKYTDGKPTPDESEHENEE